MKFLKKLSSRPFLLIVIAFGLNTFSAKAQPGANLQLRMTKKEIRSAKQDGPAAPGSSNLSSIQLIVIHGNPSLPGLYTILLKVPANTNIAAHLHPDDRVATVISGTWYFGYGDISDKRKLKKLPAGSVYTEPAGQNHFAMTGKKPVTVEITGYGPSGTIYVNPADDPQKEKK